MLKDTGYQEKIEMVIPWFEEIIEIVKKDLKNEHLKIDRAFCKKYFLGKSPLHVQTKEMAEAYRVDIAAGNVGLAEFIATRWLLRNTDVYGFFEPNLKALSQDFEQLEELPQELSRTLVDTSVAQFGAKKTYLFSVFNSVVFPPSIYENLKERALQETEVVKNTEEMQKTTENIEVLQHRHHRECAALQDRYEKKIQGMQKKYLNDVAALKKQIGTLQKKLQHG